MVNRKKLLAAFSGLLAVSLVVFQGAAATQDGALKIVCANEGSNIYTPPESVQYSYRYGPGDPLSTATESTSGRPRRPTCFQRRAVRKRRQHSIQYPFDGRADVDRTGKWCRGS